MRELNILSLENKELWVHDFGKFLFLEGSQYLPDTQEEVYKSIADSGCISTVISNLYDNPEQMMALKYLDFETIVLGTTGVKWKQIDELKRVFTEIGKMPKNIFFAMGEEYFRDFITDDMRVFKIYPIGFGDFPIQIRQFKIY